MAIVKRAKTKAIREFGDFQTPPALAILATQKLHSLGIRVRSIVEPTCGRGAFLGAATTWFPEAESIMGIDINEGHLIAAEESVNRPQRRVDLQQGDFFRIDWEKIIIKEKGPWLIIGNPPWVTSAELGSIKGANLPEKSNFQGRMGMDAITGKANFDISEWMLIRYLHWLEGSEGTIAVLCKTAVARKVLRHIWGKKKNTLRSARLYKIDALEHFGAAVDACFMVLEIHPEGATLTCDIFDSLAMKTPSKTIGFLDGHIISNVAAFNRHRGLLGPESRYIWRSGVKHDCSKVMELTPIPEGYLNGLGEVCQLEETFLFPMLKSSDIGNGRILCRSVMLVPQKSVGEDTQIIRKQARKTWRYLSQHAELLNKRGSIIYKNKPAFSVFGIGPYTFAPWKIAISGFYKTLKFLKIGPVNGKPVVFDDTIYFLSCWSEEEADFIESLLRFEAARAFYDSMVHWDEKRPITVDILKRLSIQKLAELNGHEKSYAHFTGTKDLSCLPLFVSA